MAGPIVDIPVHVCRVPKCRTIWVADPMMWVDVDVCPKCGSTWHWLSYDELDFVGEGLSNATAPEYTYPVVIRTPFVTIIQENPLDVVIEALPGQPPDESVTSYWNEDFESCST